MSLLTMQEILSESVAKHYAVGAFDTFDHSMTEAILRAAEGVDRPVILMVVEPLFQAPHFEWFFKYLVQRCEESTVPVALHLDHGFSFEGVMKAIRYGCTSVMMDGSNLPYAENVALTRKVVDVAHACGVTVEAEIGHVAGHEGNMLEGNVADESAFTKVEDARRFVEDTGVDALAIAFGTVHGVFKGEPRLDYERLKAIRETVSIPLVMHGGSGLSPEAFRKAVDNGINKINFFTGLSLGGANAIIKTVEERRKKLQFGDLVGAGMEGVSAIVREHIGIFGTQPLGR
ncbi:MAG: class II fructose-bisphosphate aldolase [Pelolinea sp.]|jgi:fructose-bisphosphate aldolase class II|nr:class II fructose-bisphosphate aldolase [Pelolinea sp.]